MPSKFRVEVLSPDGGVFDDEVEMVSTRTTVGSIGIRAKHTPLLGMLEPTELRLHRTIDSDIVRYAQGEGYVQVSADGVLVLVEEATEPGSLDTADLKDKLKAAEDALSAAEDGSEEERKARRDQRRWQTFIEISEGRHGGTAPGA